jgi:hypothetical protein
VNPHPFSKHFNFFPSANYLVPKHNCQVNELTYESADYVMAVAKSYNSAETSFKPWSDR